MFYHKNGVYIARRVTFSSLCIGSYDDTCWMLDCNYQVMYEICCHFDTSHLWEVWTDLYKQSLEVKSTCLAPMDKSELWGRWSWLLAIGWQGRIPAESVVMLRLLNFPKTLPWRTCCSEWWDKCDLVGSLRLQFGQTHWKICLLQEGGWKFLRYTFFLCYGWAQDYLF